MSYNEANLETAMCLWEAICEGALDEDANWIVKDYRKQYGTADLRNKITQAVLPCEKAWEDAEAAGTAQEPYDWEHCPKFLSQWVMENFNG